MLSYPDKTLLPIGYDRSESATFERKCQCHIFMDKNINILEHSHLACIGSKENCVRSLLGRAVFSPSQWLIEQ